MNKVLRKIMVYIINKKQIYIVNVCAWCPKDSYPPLHMWQTYSHGICKRHYLSLSKKKQKPTVQENLDKLITMLFPKEKVFQQY